MGWLPLQLIEQLPKSAAFGRKATVLVKETWSRCRSLCSHRIRGPTGDKEAHTESSKVTKVTEAHTESSRVSVVPCSLGPSHRTAQVALLSEAHTERNDSGMTLGSHTDLTNRRDLEHTAGHWYFFQKISPEGSHTDQPTVRAAQEGRTTPIKPVQLQ